MRDVRPRILFVSKVPRLSPVWYCLGDGGKGMESLDRGMGMEIDKSLQSMEAEAEHLFKEERSLLFEDDAASKRDSMFEKAEFIESELERMTEQIKSIIQTFNAKQGVDMDLTDIMTPFDAAARILISRLSSLMWIDEK
ncbi:hypothetical protein HPP92_020455 [Vanilla planifolia]|uniref:Uncharacterized protein n=1 Tax=Vanilla planifolia TaxID=51239 RepID=A0A835UGA2_VANPL|nr:hypothetical protein HPP92_020455 [Vanilla planifolia]